MATSAVAQAAEARNTPARVTPRDALRDMVAKNITAIGASLPRGFDQDRFARLLLTAANVNPELLTCTPKSFLQAGVQCAQLGLEPNDPRGLAYLVPYSDKREGKVVNLIIGYRGMMDLARRSGMVSSIHAFAVYEGDEFTYTLGLEPSLHHVPAEDGAEDPAKLTHVYAVAKVNGDPQFVVLTRKQVEKAKGSSRGASSSYSPWSTHYPEMALKTAIRRLCKMLPQTVEVAQAMEAEDRPTSVGQVTMSSDFAEDADVIDTRSIDPATGEVTEVSGLPLEDQG